MRRSTRPPATAWGVREREFVTCRSESLRGVAVDASTRATVAREFRVPLGAHGIVRRVVGYGPDVGRGARLEVTFFWKELSTAARPLAISCRVTDVSLLGRLPG